MAETRCTCKTSVDAMCVCGGVLLDEVEFSASVERWARWFRILDRLPRIAQRLIPGRYR